MAEDKGSCCRCHHGGRLEGWVNTLAALSQCAGERNKPSSFSRRCGLARQSDGTSNWLVRGSANELGEPQARKKLETGFRPGNTVGRRKTGSRLKSQTDEALPPPLPPLYMAFGSDLIPILLIFLDFLAGNCNFDEDGTHLAPYLTGTW